MIEAVPQQEMINIPGLGPMPIRNLPQGMGKLPRRAPWHTRDLLTSSGRLHACLKRKYPERRLPCLTCSCMQGEGQQRIQPQSDAPQEWKGLRQHPVSPLNLPCFSSYSW